jgi:hypothetical protein
MRAIADPLEDTVEESKKKVEFVTQTRHFLPLITVRQNEENMPTLDLGLRI